MPRASLVVALLLLSVADASAAPRYMARVRSSIARSGPAPSPVPAPGPAEIAPAPRLSRIVTLAHRTDPAAPPTLHPHAQFIDSEALQQFFPRQPESGGGFMPLAMRRDGVRPRTDDAVQAEHQVVFASAAQSASVGAPAMAATSQHNRDQGGRPADPPARGNRSRFYLR